MAVSGPMLGGDAAVAKEKEGGAGFFVRFRFGRCLLSVPHER
jgi:hypothetical protein